MTPEQRIKQSRAKWRIIARREIKAFMSGKISSAGDFDRRREIDLVSQAYAAGFRDAMLEARK